MTEEQLFDYAATHGWVASEKFLPQARWTFGMPTWRLTVRKDGEPFAESTRFGMSGHHYGELLAAMIEWDGLSEAEREARRGSKRSHPRTR